MTASPTRTAAVDGLLYAAYLVDTFGWMPAAPDEPRLSIHDHLTVAAGKTAVACAVCVGDVVGLMWLMLHRHVGKNLAVWESEPGRTSGDVVQALRSAAPAPALAA